MKLYRTAVSAAVAVAYLMLAGCAQDTPKSAFQNGDDYAQRVFVPSALDSSVKKAVSDGRSLAFNKITFTQNAKVLVQGNSVEMSRDMTYENAGDGGLVRVIDLNYVNGVVSGKMFSLTYRGLVNLYWKDVAPNSRVMPYSRRADSVSHFDTSFDQSALSYSYQVSSNAPHSRTLDRSISCALTGTYVASKVATGIQGDAREFNCKFYNDNGVLDMDANVVYLNAYGIVILQDMTKTYGHVHFITSNFKVG
ncbi:hypothetical protein [Rhodanobacter sp. DHB23]|uniref:hypothetical protein n=1 Tax=Rhodanobacter sp. DHB23 TaxID=2775923 RepID=UPI00178553A8|nr:hypothetical protein [Rhodanobacter sp. DHB23]MBD8872928.1 hypothetical protein [Rhodanobacter sp. DHB23]